MKKLNKIAIGLLILILVLVLAIGGYTIVKLNNQIEKKSSEDNELKSITQDVKDEVTEEEVKRIIDSFIKGNALSVGAGIDLNISIQYNEIPYYKVINVSELKETFSTNGFRAYMKENEIIEKDGEYYMPALGWGSDITYYGRDGYIIKSITENKIEAIFREKYYTNAEDIDKGAVEGVDFTIVENKFVVIKENGVWKVEEFTNPQR